MYHVSEAVTNLISKIGSGRCEATLAQLAGILATDEDAGILGQIAEVRSFLESINAEVIPPIDKGEIYSVRIVRFRPELEESHKALMAALNGDESSTIEFKSTFRVDLEKLKHSGLAVTQCISEEVIQSALKTVAAFLNSDGGDLYIGVTDSKEVVGLQHDFKLSETGNPDKFEQHLRNLLQSRFKDGKLINDYVSVAFIEHEQQCVAQIKVLPQNILSFYKKGDQHLLFRRQGIRTLPVDISEIEEFLRNRWNM